MGERSGRGFREILRVGIGLIEVPGDLGEGFEFEASDRSKNHVVPLFFDKYLRTREPEGFGKPHRLATAVLE